MLRRPSLCTDQRMRALDSRKNALETAAFLHRIECVRVGCHLVTNATGHGIYRVLRTDTRIVEASGNGVRLLDLPVCILKQDRITAVQNTRAACRDRCSVLAESGAASAGL